jgi:predicted permease
MTKASVRQSSGRVKGETMISDLRLAWRASRKRPGFALAAVSTLALGLGANTAVFSVVNAALLRPYPHIDADRWAYLWERPSVEGLTLLSVSVPNFRDWKAQSRSFSDLTLFFHWSYNLSGVEGGDPERLPAVVVTPDVFPSLGVPPEHGRWLADSDGPYTVLISHGLWRRRFGGDPGIVGRKIDLNLVPHTVVGVMPAAFAFPPEARTDIWGAFAADRVASAAGRDARGNRVAGRLRAGVSHQAAQAELDVIADRLAAQHPENKGFGVGLVPLREAVAGDFRTPLLTLSGALGLVLVLSCISLANVQLTRWEARRKELAVRAALGARAWRLARQVLTENLALALAAGGLGMLLAPAGTRLLLSFVPPEQIPWLSVTTDRTVWLASGGLTLSVALLTGGLSALRAARADLAAVLAASSWGSGAGSVSRRARHAFLIAQLALSLAPLAGAGLLVQSFLRLRSVDPGFPSAGRLTLSYSAPRARYPDPEKMAALAERVAAEVGQLPGVRAAGAGQALPFAAGAGWLQAFTRRDPAGVPNPADLPHVRYNVVSTGYVEALGVPLKAGRTFERTDTGESLPVVVINQALARKYFPGEDPLGQTFWVGHAQALTGSPARTVVGVVGDVLLGQLDEAVEPAAWVPVSQQRQGELVWRTLFLAVDAGTDPLAMVPAVRRRVASVDAELALTDIRSMEDRLGEALWRHRLAAGVVGALGMVALVIAVLGVFGIVGLLVSRRTGEIGVRMALGATGRDVVGLIMREGFRLVMLGTLLGLLGAVLLARSLSSLLYGVGAGDPITFAVTALALAGAALLACYLPARRAAGVSPLSALRHD